MKKVRPSAEHYARVFVSVKLSDKSLSRFIECAGLCITRACVTKIWIVKYDKGEIVTPERAIKMLKKTQRLMAQDSECRTELVSFKVLHIAYKRDDNTRST